MSRKSISERFWAKVDKTGPAPDCYPELGQCWLWTAYCDRDGYGQFSIRSEPVRAYRMAYELSVGAIPEGLQLDHICRTRQCVNPRHLEPVTCQENVLRSDGLASENAKKTHCPQGHSYSVENTYIKKGRKRVCRTCELAANRRRYYQKLELVP